MAVPGNRPIMATGESPQESDLGEVGEGRQDACYPFDRHGAGVDDGPQGEENRRITLTQEEVEILKSYNLKR